MFVPGDDLFEVEVDGLVYGADAADHSVVGGDAVLRIAGFVERFGVLAKQRAELVKTHSKKSRGVDGVLAQSDTLRVFKGCVEVGKAVQVGVTGGGEAHSF